ncbi:MAG: hypothetical protein ABI621_16240 [Chloroflexota bacterium]
MRHTKQNEDDYNQPTTQLRAMLAETEFNTFWAEGRAMTMEQAIQLALNYSG